MSPEGAGVKVRKYRALYVYLLFINILYALIKYEPLRLYNKIATLQLAPKN